MKRFNHAFTLGFAVQTDCDCKGDNYPTNEEMKQALLDRIAELDEHDIYDECCGAPFDSFENDDNSETRQEK